MRKARVFIERMSNGWDITMEPISSQHTEYWYSSSHKSEKSARSKAKRIAKLLNWNIEEWKRI